MNTLTEMEYVVLDELYFVSAYPEILLQVNMEEQSFRETIASLLKKELLVQLTFNAFLNDFEKLEQPDFSALETSSYVASRKGLLTHISR